MTSVQNIYKQLKKQHNHIDHNWWPTSGKFRPVQLEIVVGAFLTQNTNWRNAEKALANLANAGKVSAPSISNTPLPTLRQLVKPSGFYRQKARRLRDFCKSIDNFDGNFYKDVTREQLLAITGIGRETADSILLYACNKPSFVIDAYTKRLLLRENLINGKEKYDQVKELFESNLPKNVKFYKEFHALIVENGKSFKAPRA